MTVFINWRVRIERLMKACKDGRRERALVIRLPRKVSKEQTSRGTGIYLSSPSYLGSCCSRIAG